MARDRHRLNRLRKDKKTETAEIEKLFEQSNQKVKQRLARFPKSNSIKIYLLRNMQIV
jgi:ATP-dependent helicase HrpA